ncbi:MAG: protoheme IX farnesyltransferase [Omnitrophica bacterium GWA2_52_8]|nr:MAG: protoheme IX farnesyltransferase [Omnitrophica bacterium GWA2_52_8]
MKNETFSRSLPPAVSLRERCQDLAALTKARLVSLVLLSVAAGYALASQGPVNGLHFVLTLSGAALVAAGSMVLNEWIEREVDAKMVRTQNRPIPAGKISPLDAVLVGSGFFVSGGWLLYSAVNAAASFLAVLTTVIYLVFYTPLKKKTSLCTIVGAVSGALPPLIGWAAVRGVPNYHAWLLFTILFLWQMPHFLALDWIYRKDFAAAGFQMLSVHDPSGERVGRQFLIYSSALFSVSLLPALAGMAGPFYFLSALILGMLLVWLAFCGMKNMDAEARTLFRYSIIHLTLLLLLMVIDKV